MAASLPSLPFKSGSFDLALCGHLLFAYSPLADGGLFEDDCFDLAWHQVRIYPAHTASRPARIHPDVEPLLAQLPPPWPGQLITTAYDQGFEGPTPLLLLERNEAVSP